MAALGTGGVIVWEAATVTADVAEAEVGTGARMAHGVWCRSACEAALAWSSMGC